VKNKINILFVILQMKPGGSEKLVYELISGLDKSIFSPSIAWFRDMDMVKDFEKLNIALYYVPKIKRLDLQAVASLSKVIKTTKPQIVNVHHSMPLVYSYFGCKLRNHVKLVYTEHSLSEVKIDSLLWNSVKGYMLKNCDAIIGVSEEISNSLRMTYNLKQKQVYSIKNGVNINKFSKGNDEVNQAGAMGHHHVCIVMVANFRKNKNHVFLLKSFSDLRKKYNNVHLVLIGQGFKNDPENSEHEILDTIKKLNLGSSVSLLGYCQNVSELLSQMDIACLCSDKEGLPLSLLEAMAAELPIVGTNVEGIRDVVLHNYNGFLVEKGNIQKFANALDILVKDRELRKTFGRRSREIAAQQYSLENCIKEYEKLFMDLLESPS
jgi:glycosyltransferase involved in cell wall biosynthesis